VDPEQLFFLTGSSDSAVLVWSLLDLLVYDEAEDSWQSDQSREPIHNLASHRAPITAIRCGHSKSSSNIAISLSEDRTVSIWHYTEGNLLRSYLLDEIPLSLSIDPADRALYVGYQTGAIQLIEFYSTESIDSTSSNIINESPNSTAIQPGKLNYLEPPNSTTSTSEFGSANCLTLNYDGTHLFSGHNNGCIAIWDINQGQFEKELCVLPGPVTNLLCMEPQGFMTRDESTTKLHTVVKPKIDGNMMADTVATTELLGPLPDVGGGSFADALSHPFFSDDLIWEALNDKESASELRKDITMASKSEDFISLEKGNDDGGEVSAERQVQLLKEQLDSLQRTQRESFRALSLVRRERDVLLQQLKDEEEDEDEDEDDEDDDDEEEEEDDDDDDEED
jgi:pre-rRNA-processing protein IPI3